ncbi:MAG TPA: helix-hairpin-helix domain-containing protein, partial [Gemmatimonadales bacterium]|nr:helix-hairpin-helix domain-containing protein [Gemmatimonadales bacterium]
APEGLTNAVIAGRLDEVARLLEEQGANPYRVRAYRLGAGTLRGLPVPASEIFASEGFAGLERLPAVGPGLAAAIGSLLTRGRLPLLDRLRGEVGNLPPAPALSAPAPPPVAELLSVDREYRTRAAAGDLVKIAPRKENPDHVAWLPILHTHRLNRDYTALYSNTARAHQLGRTQDWVVLYVDGDRPALQYTVVTPHRGPLAGMRVVRGREAECLELVARRRRRRRQRASKAGSGEIK